MKNFDRWNNCGSRGNCPRIFHAGMEAQNRFSHSLGQQAAHLRFLVEFHLALGRMDVHVHRRRIQFEEQAAHGIPAFHQRGVIPLDQRVVEAAIFHRPAVDIGNWPSRVARETPGEPINPQTRIAESGAPSAAFRRGVFKNIGFVRHGFGFVQ